MYVITKKVKLVRNPDFVGTRISINVKDDQPSFGIYSAMLTAEHPRVTIDWGDGEKSTVESVNRLSHRYVTPGTYVVSISDDVQRLEVSVSDELPPFTDEYVSRITRVRSNAATLFALKAGCFNGAVNLQECELRESLLASIVSRAFQGCKLLERITLPDTLLQISPKAFSGCSRLKEINLPPQVDFLNAAVFQDCVSLSGRIELPYIQSITDNTSDLPFGGCTGGIAEFAFAKANEETIKQSKGYQADPTLGTGTAVCTFDL